MKKILLCVLTLSSFLWFTDCSKTTAPDNGPVATATVNLTPTPATGNDAFEPDNNTYTARAITTNGHPQYHNFYSSDSFDYVSFTAEAGSRYMISAVVSYTGTMNYLSSHLDDSDTNQVNYSTNSASETGSNTLMYVFSCGATGTYFADIWNSYAYSGAETGYLLSVEKLAPIAAADFSTAINNSSLTFSFSPASSWFGQFNISHDGISSVQSGPTAHSGSSEFTAVVSAGAEVSFYWKVSSDRYGDKLNFYDNGVEKFSIDGVVDWTPVNYIVPSDASPHTLKWEYKKDGSWASGYDAGWVDQLSVIN
jgi:hypothetical protein